MFKFLLSLFFIFLFELNMFAQMVTTVAGSSSGYKDGSLKEARFSGLTSLVFDSTGTIIYVTDAINKQIRKIDLKNNTVSTLTFVNTDSGADFKQPNALAIDKKGNIFIADFYDRDIKKISIDGRLSVYAGSTYGNKNGNALQSKFAGPTDIDVDNAGNVYVADYLNYSIRKIDTSRNVSTLAGSVSGFIDGTGTNARFRLPHDIAVDRSGNVYVSDTYNYHIRKITSEGIVTTVAGSAKGHYDGPFGKLDNPNGLVVDTIGNVYVTDFWTNKIRKITPEGMVSTIAGSTRGYEDGFGDESKFNGPTALALDKEGNLYVTDYYNNRIRKITFEEPFWLRWWFITLEIVLLVLAIIGVIILFYNRKLQHERQKNVQLNKMYDLEIKAMKAQMNPHFIFNSLNSIQEFILENDNDNACNYLSRFSLLVRRILESNMKESISLEDEVKILEGYLEIESLRFQDSFMYEINIDKELVSSQIIIPHMLIQPFVENSIWHGLLHKKGDRKLMIKFSGLDNKRILCEVDDNGIGRGTIMDSDLVIGKKSLAIDLIKQRLSLLCKTNGIECGINVIDKKEAGKPIGTRVEIIIPLLN